MSVVGVKSTINMSQKDYDEYFLTRWLGGQLKADEERDWLASAEHEKWQRVQTAIERRALPRYDTEAAYVATRERLPKRRVQPLRTSSRRLWIISAAAAVLLAVAFFFLRPQSVSWSAPVAAQVQADLPDGSTVSLNAGSELSYTTHWRSGVRQATLTGEAFFEVARGEPFAVKTAQGEVAVLGTKFNVMARSDWFEVYCTEGKVAVSYQGERYELSAGEGIRPTEATTIYQHPHQSPTWTAKESQFNAVPLSLVFEELERQYGITVEQPDGLEGRTYTGRFPHDDLERALALICGAMNLRCERSADGQRVIVK